MRLEQDDQQRGGMIWPEAKKLCYQPTVNYFPINPCLEGFYSSYHNSLPRLMIFSLLINDVHVYSLSLTSLSFVFLLKLLR